MNYSCNALIYIGLLFHLIPVIVNAHSGHKNDTESELSKDIVAWESLPPLPDSIGVAGAFTGKHNQALIVAGGANFPSGPPWESGERVYHDQIYVLEKEGDSYNWFQNDQLSLPLPLAYGVTISTEDGIICIGGTDGKKTYDDVFLLSWDSNSKTIETDDLPSLPVPLAFMTGTRIGQTIYVAGGQEKPESSDATMHFFSLDLSPSARSTQHEWISLPPWSGPPRVLAVSAVQDDGINENFYLFSGRNIRANGTIEVLNDGFSYNPRTNKWKTLDNVLENKSELSDGRSVMAGTAIPYGSGHILFFGGDDGRALKKRLNLIEQIDTLSDALQNEIIMAGRVSLREKIDSLQKELHSVLTNKSDFSRDILSYHTITDSWAVIGKLPTPGPVTTTAIKWDANIIIPTGEISPGIRTSDVWKGTVTPETPGFGVINYSVLTLYMALMVLLGFYFSKKGKNTDNFFLADKRIPWWAAGVSIYATQLSAITFIAVPAIAFTTNWEIFPAYLTILLIVPIVITFYLPFFRRLNITTAYQYLEKRFNLSVRLFGSMSFIIFQLGRMSVLVFLPALAITAILGMNIYVAIILMGLLAIFYTMLGGMEAVIWTDVVQVVILVSGIIYSILFIIIDTGGFETIYAIASMDNKLQMFDWRINFRDLVTWSIFLGTFALQFGPYTTDQAVIQRYLTTKNEDAAAKSLWVNGFMSIPTGFLFFALGTGLYAFYKLNPELIFVGMESDQIFPLFIGQQLPLGLAGLVIAGIFAASMSSLDSSMHSISTAWTVDFHDRFNPGSTEEHRLRLARIIIIIVGLFGTAMACILASFPIRSLYFLFQEIIGLLGSALAGIFILGIFTRKASGTGVLIGALASLASMALVKFSSEIHFYIYPLIGIPVCLVAGYIFSLIFLAPDKNLEELTYSKLTNKIKNIRNH
ncbi:MAG: sodium/solute symporter [Balneolales bacterium]